MAFSRGLYTGWFKGTNNQELAHARFGTKRGVFLGEVSRGEGESVSLRLQAPLKPGDGIVFDAGKPDQPEQGGRVYQATSRPSSSGETTLQFGHGDIDWRRVRVGQLVWKTNDPALDRDLRASFEGEQIRFQRAVSFEVHGRAGTPLTLIANDGEGHVVKVESTMPLAVAERHPLTPERLREQLGRLGGTPFKLGELKFFLEGSLIIPVSELNRIRRASATELEALRAQPRRWRTQELRMAESGSRITAECSSNAHAPELVAVIRLLEQLEAAWAAGARTIYCEFENPKHYREAVARFRELQSAVAGNPESEIRVLQSSTIWVAPP